MKPIYSLSMLFFFLCSIGFAQNKSISIDTTWWAKKEKSIFQLVDKGTFNGVTNGYLQVKNGKDTLLLDFQTSKTVLKVIHDPDEMYDKSTKEYVTQTTSGKTSVTYEVYASANVLTLNIKGLTYYVGLIDGASDMSISGLSVNYCSEKTTEFLTLFVTKPIELKLNMDVMRKLPEGDKLIKTITLLPGSTLVYTLHKN